MARLSIDQLVTLELQFLVFFPAILAAALWLGTGPALFCTLLSGLAAAWYWIPPRGSIAVASTADVQGLTLFALSGALITWLVEFWRKSRTRNEEAEPARRDVAELARRQGEAEKHMVELSEAVSARTDELKQNEALMQTVVDSAVDAILMIDERGTVRSFNRAAERMFGYSAAEILGHNVNLLMPSPYHEEHDVYIRRYLASGVKKIIGIGREITARRKDGSTFPMHLSVSEARIAEGRLFTGFVRDLSEQKRLEQEFLRSQKMEAIGSLSGAIAHDFNNILMGILACARLAADERRQDASSSESFDEIAAAANRGVALTRRLLAFSRKAAPVELHPTSIDDILRENETMLRQLLGEGVDLHIELSPSEAALLADQSLIEQIVINLLVNARDAMPNGGKIEVSTRVDAEELVLEVTDTGCGIPYHLRPRIFEPFFTTKEPDKGTGLGLSTVKRITEQLHGRIELESEPGRGTTFRLAFPRCAPASKPAVAAARAPIPRQEGRTLLLVEDDRLVRASLLRFLKRKGYTVLVAASPSDALSAARSVDSIDLLVTDMVLPEITGSELAKRLRESAPRMKVIYMSAHPVEVLHAQGHLLGDAPYLEKPFEMEELDAVVSRLLAEADETSTTRAPFASATEPATRATLRGKPS